MSPATYRRSARVRGVAMRVAAPVLLGGLALAAVVGDAVAPGLLVALIAAGFVAFLVSVALGMFPIRVDLVPRAISPPVRGRWRALNSPGTKVPSHGTNGYGQTYAIDLIYDPPDWTGPKPRGFEPARGFPTFGQAVLAPADGVVVVATSRMRDHRCRAGGPALAFVYLEGFVRELLGVRFMLGNHVVLDLGDGVLAAFAHLQQGSTQVRVGQRVHAGEVVARAGNSGNSSEPHLHFHLMDHPRPLYAAGMPFDLPGGVPPNEAHLDTAAGQARTVGVA